MNINHTIIRVIESEDCSYVFHTYGSEKDKINGVYFDCYFRNQKGWKVESPIMQLIKHKTYRLDTFFIIVVEHKHTNKSLVYVFYNYFDTWNVIINIEDNRSSLFSKMDLTEGEQQGVRIYYALIDIIPNPYILMIDGKQFLINLK
jgi:hypothetical protein